MHYLQKRGKNQEGEPPPQPGFHLRHFPQGETERNTLSSSAKMFAARNAVSRIAQASNTMVMAKRTNVISGPPKNKISTLVSRTILFPGVSEPGGRSADRSGEVQYDQENILQRLGLCNFSLIRGIGASCSRSDRI